MSLQRCLGTWSPLASSAMYILITSKALLPEEEASDLLGAGRRWCPEARTTGRRGGLSRT